jgi:uncharacterized protein (DUF927 family)
MYSKFLKRVLATDGWYCIVGLKEGARTKQIFKESLEEVDEVVTDLLKNSYNVYFGCAKYKENTKRIKDNADHFKSFWLDLDCGSSKAYPSQEAALTDLARFCEETTLPMPTLVDSGYGIHCYWRLSAAVSRAEWKPLAERLKVVCKEHGLKADPAVTADEARILRVPGTLNFKGNPPVDVGVLASSARLDIEDFRKTLGGSALLPPVPDYIRREVSPLQQKLMQNRTNVFQKILEKSFENNGCLQIASIAIEQADTDYNLWRAGLSIARNCADWKVAIHVISSDHPNYDFDLTERKAEDLADKPYLCKTFEDLRPEYCADCKFKGKIKSPISLGSEVLRAESDTIEYVKEESEEPEESEADEETDQETTVEVVSYKVPPYPYPFFRGKTGGVYRRTEDDDDKLIYENDLYIIKRMDDYERGELALARVHLPKDKPKEFIIPLTAMNSKDELRKILASQGVLFMPIFIDGIMMYLIESVKMHQIKSDAEVLRQQMGWVEGENKFVLGTQEFNEYGARYSPPSAKTESLAPWLTKKGSLENWKDVANVYNRPGFEPHAFAFFTGFGSVLMPFTNYKGAFINLINKESGTGKTTILHMINSVWGHPQELLSKESDTLAHKLFRLGVLQNLPFTADELSNMAPENVSQLLYSISQGKGAGRMQSQANMERKNDTTWSTIGVGSSNSSMVESLAIYKSAANGEIMRLLEYQIRRTNLLGKQEAHEIFEGLLYSNYGHAGPIYIQWVLKNRDEVMELISNVQKHVDEKAKFTNQNRYWSAVIACNIAGALIAQHLELISIDPTKILDWVIETLVPELKGIARDSNNNYATVLGDFMNENIANALIVNDKPDERTKLPTAPIQEPRLQLLLRAEPDTKTVWISSKAFKEFCVKQRIIYKDLLETLRKQDIYLGEFKKRLGKGTKLVTSPAVMVYQFKYEFDDLMQDIGNANSHD